MYTKKIGDLATYINGYAFKPSDWGESGLPIVRIQDLTGTSYQTNYYDGDYPKKIEINNGDVLISWSASLGVYVWDRGKALLNQHIFKVVFDKEYIDKNYFVYAIKHSLNKMTLKTHGATMKHIVKNDFYNIEIPYPNRETQIKMSKALLKVENVIEYRKQQLEQFDLLIKSRFVEMFGDVISNEKKWNMSIWNDVLSIKNGRNQKTVENINGKYAIYGSGGIMGYATDYITEANSVIIGRKGNINKPILMRERFWNVDTAFGLEPKQSINVEYLYMFCLLFDFDRLNKAVTIPSLTKADLLNIKMPVPPIELQNEFARFVEQVEETKTQVQKSLDEAQLLFNSLMQEYFG